MRLILLEASFERWCFGNTLEVQILHFDWDDGDTCLLGGGWYQGKFWFDICFWRAFKQRFFSN